MRLSVIIPSFNEEKNLQKNILKYNKYLSRQNFDYEIIIVNDGSTDKTAEIAGELNKKNNNIKFIDNKINRGKGAAIKQGLLAASGDYRLFIDADNATSIEHIKKTWPLFESGYEVIIGSRSPRDAGGRQVIPQNFLKRALGKIGNLIIQLLTVKGIWDTQCGFKAFTEKAVKDIISKATINRFGIDVEILVIAKSLGYKIAVIPVLWKNSADSRVGFKGYLTTLPEIIKIKFNLITGKYKKI